MKTEISILLPSLRPEALTKSIREFDETNFSTNYELVVVSPFEVKGIKTKWIKEDVCKGSAPATNVAWENSSSEYVVYFSDDVSPTKDCLKNMLNFMKDKKEHFIGAFKMMHPNGKEIGPFGCYDRLYACYGCLSRDTVYFLGNVFHKDFMYSWGDIDASLKCWTNNGSVEICQDACVIPRQIDDEIYREHRSKYWEQDVETFLNKWHPILGKDYERNTDKINRRLKLTI